MADRIWKILKDTREKLEPAVSEVLLKRCYDVEMQFQHDEDRGEPRRQLKLLIEAEVESKRADLEKGEDSS